MHALTVVALAVAVYCASAAPSKTLDIVERVNSLKTTWTAKHYNTLKKRRNGVKEGYKNIKLEKRRYIFDDVIPESFDARQKWPQCINVIGNIRDQSDCGSCWAVAAASVFSDRKCIASNGRVQTSYSAEDTLSCCTLQQSEGCDGGFPAGAWQWFVSVGVVSGGNFTNKSGCRPYLFCPPDAQYSCETPSCQTYCDGNLPHNDYYADKHRAASAYTLDQNVTQMQYEVMTKGSIEVTFAVYEDFYNYEGGVYQRTPGSELAGYHAVRLIGWGVEDGTPYWLIANSWDSDWGINGYFKILRGYDECGIEEDPVAGEVDGDA